MNFACGGEKARAAERQPVIDALADDQEEVGLAEDGVHGVVERGVGIAHGERMIVGHGAARHRDGVERKLRALDEVLQRGLGAGPPDAAAGDHDRPFGGADQADGLGRWR